MQKSYYCLSIMYTMHLTTGLLTDMVPQRSCKEIKEKPQERQGVDWTSWVFIIPGAVETARAPRDRAGYLVAFVATRWALLDVPSTRQLA